VGRTYAADDRSVPESTLVELFFEAVDRFGDAPAFQRFETAERVVDIPYSEAVEQVRLAAGAMSAVGVGRGDRVAILSENRPEWAIADWACLCSGVVGVPIYPTLSAAQVRYILRDSGARLGFASSKEQADKIRASAADLGRAIPIVSFDGESGSATPWADFLEAGRDSAPEPAATTAPPAPPERSRTRRLSRSGWPPAAAPAPPCGGTSPTATSPSSWPTSTARPAWWPTSREPSRSPT